MVAQHNARHLAQVNAQGSRCLINTANGQGHARCVKANGSLGNQFFDGDASFAIVLGGFGVNKFFGLSLFEGLGNLFACLLDRRLRVSRFGLTDGV